MIRLNLMLVLAVVLSALYLVSVQYSSRRLFAELDKVGTESRRLVSERENLQAQLGKQATASRVEHLAVEKLKMHQATPGITLYVSYAEPTAPITSAEPVQGGNVSQGVVK